MRSPNSIPRPMSNPARLVMYAIALAVLALLPGCASQLVATAEPFCDAAKPVCISRADILTEGTASQIEKNNAGLQEICKPKADLCADYRVKVKKPSWRAEIEPRA